MFRVSILGLWSGFVGGMLGFLGFIIFVGAEFAEGEKRQGHRYFLVEVLGFCVKGLGVQ